MKTYILDKSLYLLIGVSIMIAFPILSTKGIIVKLIVDIVVACAWIHTQKPLLLLPFDLKHGKKSEKLYFERCLYADRFDIFADKCYLVWRLYDYDKTIDLIAPEAIEVSKLSEYSLPPKDKELMITYYSKSKILISWEICDGW